jgi:NitT/TauT family transport system substrate-binding protein
MIIRPIFAVILVFILSGISWGAELKKLRVLKMPYISFAPIFVAEEEGYFRAEGLDIEFVHMRRSSQAIPLLVKGRFDVSAGTTSFSLFNAIAGGANLRIVAGKSFIAPGDCTTFVLMRKNLGLERKHLKAEELRGCRAALNPTSSRGYYFQKFLEPFGLDITKMEIVDIKNNMKAEAFKNGVIDLSITSEPWNTRILDAGHAKVLKPVSDFITGFQRGFIVFGPNLLENDPELGTRFVRAYLKGVSTYNRGKTERNVDILSQYTGLDRPSLKRICWPKFRQGGAIYSESIVAFQKWGAAIGKIDRVILPEEFWEPKFILQSLQP